MSAADQKLSLQEKCTCPMCRQYFTNPMIIACGHSFCFSCIDTYWKDLDEGIRCPQCQAAFEKRSLRKNRDLTYLVQRAKALAPKRGREEPDQCKKHQQTLRLFCKEDQEAMCVMCDIHKSRERGARTAIPIEEAAKEYKAQFQSSVAAMKTELDKVLDFQSKGKQKASELQEIYKSQRDLIMREYDQLKRFLEEEHTRLLAKLKEEEQEVRRLTGESLDQLEEHHCTLRNLIREIEEKCLQPDAALLQDAKSTLSRCEKVAAQRPPGPLEIKRGLQNLFKWHVSLQERTSKFTEWRRARSFAVEVTLDTETAHPRLILSEDLKSVSHGDTRQNLLNGPKRFSHASVVLGDKGFTSGRHYWEVRVGDKTYWDIGICNDSVIRKGTITGTPQDGYWRVLLREGDKYRLGTFPAYHLTPRVRPRVIGIFLDYEGGRLSFYNVDDKSHLYTFIHIFTDTIRPYFSPGLNMSGTNAGPLAIVPLTWWN